jgi:copper chaperone CopZ
LKNKRDKMQGSFKIDGIKCKSCGVLIKDALTEAGVNYCNIDIERKTIVFDFDKEKIKLSEIKDIIEKEGFGVR